MPNASSTLSISITLLLVERGVSAILLAYGVSAIGTFLIATLLNNIGCEFRVAKAEEEAGLDISEHGEEAYSERTGSPLLN